MSIELLRIEVSYNPNTGTFTYINNLFRSFKSTEAGYIGSDGYIHISINGKDYKAHRLAYALMLGHFPSDGFVVDHINGDKLDNRWSNLRLATHAQNIQNSKLRSDNSSGFKGVTYRKSHKKFIGQVNFNGKPYYTGFYSRAEDCAAELKNIRENLHKEFTNHGSV